MRVLILGAGAKDHAIAWWFSRSNLVTDIFCAPGNIATGAFATNLPDVDSSNPDEVYDACIRYGITYVFIGTEAPLLAGMIDFLQRKGICTFGAPLNSLRLEGDRNFARAFTDRHNIPTPRRNLFESLESLKKFLSRHEGEHFVLKSNTVAPSRIMIDSSDSEALLSFAEELFKRGSVLLEEHCTGLPLTATVIVDSNGYLALPFTSDYMYTSANEGIPTGGMGAVCPIQLKQEYIDQIREQIIEPTIYGIKVEQLAYKGVLTFSIILHEDRAVLVDYHVRFNDPASQALIPLIKNDIVELLDAVRDDRVSEVELKLSNESSVAVVIASEGYPMNPVCGKPVSLDYSYLLFNMLHRLPMVFTGAVGGSEVNALTTSGGRCFTFVGRGKNIKAANENAYRLIDSVRIDGSWYRDDIGTQFFISDSDD